MTAATACGGRKGSNQSLMITSMSSTPTGNSGWSIWSSSPAGTIDPLPGTAEGVQLQAVDQFTLGVFTDLGQVFFELAGQGLDLLVGLLQFAQGILHRQHGRIVAAATHRPGQVAEVGQL